MFATALLLVSVLSDGRGFDPASAPTPSAEVTAGQPQSAPGLLIAADIDGHLAIYDSNHRLVMELDKAAGRQLQISLEPGAYEARLDRQGVSRAKFFISEGRVLVLASANFREDTPPPPQPLPPPPNIQEGHAYPVPAPHALPLDARHRIEMRFGAWGDGWYSHDHHSDYWNTGQAAFGFEYLTFLSPDLGVGVAVTGLGRGEGDWYGWDTAGAAQAICSIPFTVRWYPLRRATRSRAVEPYVTGGIGPVFAVDTISTHDYDSYHWDDSVSTTHVQTAFGGRVGGGVDFRLGSIFTLGFAGAWNWDTGFSETVWKGERPGGGEFTMTFGWNFGR
jgi:hypothetical protein